VLRLYGYLQNLVMSLEDREEGQALVEYALILALVSVVAILLLTSIGENIVSKFQEVVNALGGGDGGTA
jgi:pilus assembly protein Flp/PilA